MTGISTALVENCTLFREGLSKILARTGFIVTEAAATADEIAAESSFEPEVVIIGARDNDRDLEENIRTLRARFSASRLVVLADQYSPGQVHAAFRLSVRGYLMKSIDSATLIKSLELIMLGETIFPSAIFTRMADERDLDIGIDDEIIPDPTPPMRAPSTLSSRERQILQCLVRGQSNKLIARDLNIVEATVKVHIKAILRKIPVQNRTQAAIWALNRFGLGDMPGSSMQMA